jgi:hypothetical protein
MPGALISPHSLLRCRSVRVPKRVHTGFIAVAKPLSNLVGHDRPQTSRQTAWGERASIARPVFRCLIRRRPWSARAPPWSRRGGEGSGVLLLIITSRSSFAVLQEALLGQGLARTRFEISLQAASCRFICNRDIRAKNCRQVLAGGNDPALLMRCKSTPKIVRGTDVDVAAAELKKINVPQTATVSLRP